MIQIDMDMPKCCADCDMETYEENYNGDHTFHYCPMVYKGYTNKIRDRKRLNDCPMKEVKHGKWIPVEKYGLHKCSVCKYEYRIEPVESFKFCPNCGARMNG